MMAWIKPNDNESVKKEIQKVLCIGNSFSMNSFMYVYDVCASAGKDVVIGVAHQSGGDLMEQWENLQNDEPITAYRKWSKENGFEDNSNPLLKDIIADEVWDIVILQQVSTGSGDYNTFQPYLNNLTEYVKSNVINNDLRLGLNMTWAYSKNSTSRFQNIGFENQIEMFDSIIETYRTALKSNDFEILIPTGTAIQNGRNDVDLSTVGIDLTSDNAHLDEGYGMYIAGLTVAKTLFDVDIIGGVEFRPNEAVAPDAYMTYLSKVAASNASINPFKITTMQNVQG